MLSYIKKYPKIYHLLRYGIVGVLNNLLAYAIYLLVTYFWLDPKLTITLLYPVGIAVAYFTHAKYSFTERSGGNWGIFRFLISYLFVYVVNIFMLNVLADRLGFPHQIVQIFAIIVISAILYLLLKYFVFTSNPHNKA